VHRLALILILIFSSVRIYSQDNNLKEFYIKFKTGNYQAALQELEAITAASEFDKTRYYLMAICFKNMQSHNKAVDYFKLAIKLGNTSDDIFYEYGQSLFAINDLNSASRAFRISFKKNYKRDYSLYYMAHIGELLEDHKLVKLNYLKLIKDKNTLPDMKQVAYLRLAELIYKLIQNKFYSQTYIEKYVIPLLEKGEAINPKSDTASEIQSRYDEILLKHNMHPLLLDNGRMLSRQATNVTFTQEVRFDDNVTLESDSPGLTATNTDTASSIYFTDIYFSKRYLSGRRFIFTPEMRFSYSEYGEENNPDIAQNDSYSIAPALRGSYEFSWNKLKSSLLYELEYNYSARDKNQVGERTFFGRSLTYTLGLRRRFFKNGDTTVKLRQRSLTSFSDALSGTTTTLYFDQLWVRENGHIIVGLFITDFYRPTSEFSATDSYLFRVDYLMPRLFWGLDFNWSASVSMLDTKLQKEVRGVERNTLLGLKIQKRLNRRWRLGLTYNYNQNDSSDEVNFSYKKTTYGLELRYSFR